MKTGEYQKSDFFAIVAALLWGVNYVAVKSVLGTMPEHGFLLVRFTATVVLLLLFLRFTGEGFHVGRRDIPAIVILGVLGVGVYQILWTIGLRLTTASNAALIVSTSPLFTQLYLQLAGKERIGGRRWAGTFLAFGGVVLVVGGSPGADFDAGSRFFTGNLVVLLSALLFAFYTVSAKPLLRTYSPAKLNALAMTAGLPVFIAFFAARGPFDITALSGMNLVKMLYIVVLGTVVAFISWYAGIRRLGPVQVILFHYIVPVTSMILGFFFLGESMNPAQALGGMLALGGIISARSG